MRNRGGEIMTREEEDAAYVELVEMMKFTRMPRDPDDADDITWYKFSLNPRCPRCGNIPDKLIRQSSTKE